MKPGSRVITTLTCDAVLGDVPFGGPQYSITGEKIFLYHHACRCGKDLGCNFLNFFDESGFVTDLELVENKLANLGECIVDCVAQLEVVYSQ